MASRLVKLRWSSPTQARTFAVAVVVLSAVLGAAAVRVAYPAQLADSRDVEQVRRAARLDSRNDEIQHALGIAEQWLGGDRKEAARHFQQATTLNPRRAEYWSDLAQNCFANDDVQCAESGYLRAARLAPRRPAYRLDLANYYLVTGRRDPALQAFSELLAIAPEDAHSALDLCLRAYQDPAIVWDSVLEPLHNTGAQLTFLSLMAARQMGDTAPYWTRVRDSHFTFRQAAPYVDALLGSRVYPQAQQVWSDMEHAGVIPALDGSGVYNGDFEADPVEAGFDWHLAHGQQFIEASLDASVAHSGRRSMRVDFTVPQNSEYIPGFETIAVSPNQPLTLKAWVKSDSITSDSGPRLRVVDPQCYSCLDVSTEGTTGTTDWHEVGMTFTPGPHTRAIQLMVWRGRGRAYPMEIGGTFWVDSISLLGTSALRNTGQ